MYGSDTARQHEFRIIRVAVPTCCGANVLRCQRVAVPTCCGANVLRCQMHVIDEQDTNSGTVMNAQDERFDPRAILAQMVQDHEYEVAERSQRLSEMGASQEELAAATRFQCCAELHSKHL
jgi:hypothetical protein